jgi:hypothetical protein
MLTDKIVCIKIGLDGYDDFLKQVLDLMVNINVKGEWTISLVPKFFIMGYYLLLIDHWNLHIEHLTGPLIIHLLMGNAAPNNE